MDIDYLRSTPRISRIPPITGKFATTTGNQDTPSLLLIGFVLIGRGETVLRRWLAVPGLACGMPRFRKHRGIFRGILKLAYVSATLAYAFADRAVWHGNHPMVGTMRVYVLRKLALVLCRRYDALIHPALSRAEGYVQVEGKVAYRAALGA